MIVLGLDTATFTASAALLRTPEGDALGAGDSAAAPELLAEGTLDTSGRGDDLLVLIDELCRKARVAPTQLGAVAVGAGPGSFTGLRIGMATAKGIAFAAGCPLWLVSSLAAMAAEEAAAAPPPTAPRLVVPVLDARRGEVFAGFFALAPSASPQGAPALATAAAEQVLAPEDVPAAIQAAAAAAATGVADLACCGDALEVHGAALASLAARWSGRARTPAGAWIARLALRGDRHDALRAGRPAYLRPAEAEIMYPDGVPGALRKLVLPSTLPEKT
jgi:tRNA threonylcarbamoyladenosine biosynthesis protein TsaB